MDSVQTPEGIAALSGQVLGMVTGIGAIKVFGIQAVKLGAKNTLGRTIRLPDGRVAGLSRLNSKKLTVRQPLKQTTRPTGGTGGANQKYTPPPGGGGITSTIRVNGKQVNFGHGGRHLEGTGLNANRVNQAIANEVSLKHPGTGQFYSGKVVVDGVTIKFKYSGTSICR